MALSLDLHLTWHCQSLKNCCKSEAAQILSEFHLASNIFMARRAITQQPLWGWLPKEFHHQDLGNLLSIPEEFHHGFKICVVVSRKETMVEDSGRSYCAIYISINGCRVEEIIQSVYIIQSEHLLILHCELLNKEDGMLEQNSKILFEFSTTSQDIDTVH
uniref:Uncharacterized protein n=1 Tax=Brassica oleracea var. oleracea TaxID=109376 RepID=A0A0D3E4J1_BRAOL